MDHAVPDDLALDSRAHQPAVGHRGIARWSAVAARQLTPGVLASFYYFARFGALVSRRAEIPVS